MSTEKEIGNLLCSFCNKHQKDVRWLVLGPEIKRVNVTLFSISICDECVDLAAEIVAEERAKKNSKIPLEEKHENSAQP